MSTILVDGLTLRPATREDTDVLFGLIRAYDYAMHGELDFTLADVQNWLSGPGLNLAEDSVLAFDANGQLVGVLILEHANYAKFFALVRILPGYENPRLGNFFIDYAESRVRQQMAQAEPGVRVTLAFWATATDLVIRQMAERADYQEIRRFWRMEIEMKEAPQVPPLPAGVKLRPFVVERDKRAVFEAVEAAFGDHWGFVEHNFDEWQHEMIERESFDPSLWFIAYEDDQVTGASICVNHETYGWVDTLGVLRPWRRKGLALALLLHSFGEFYRRGYRRVGLSVDSESLTGATRLYERAGMHMVREGVRFEKELRAGVELSTQTLSV